MKILINIPSLSFHGGVSNHYIGLRPFWKEEVYYNVVGKRSKKGSGALWLPFDLLKFVFTIILWNPDAIIINPSLGGRAIMRDCFFIKLACIFNKKFIVFIHGWNREYAIQIDKNRFNKIFNNSSRIIVLAQEFKHELIEWGITVPICLTSTKVDDRLLENFDIKLRDRKIKTLLFLARVEIEKGIFLTIDTFAELKKKYSDLVLVVVGDGSSLENAKKYVLQNKIKDVSFRGLLSGGELINEFNRANLYILPTYGEGMPTSVLEAMAFGLPVITRPVGGLVDFFENGKMGYMIESLNSKDYADAIENLILNIDLVNEISIYNQEYAKKNFLASKIAPYLENIIKSI